MVKKEIREIKLNIGEESVSVKPPFSVIGASNANRTLQNDTKVWLTAVIRADSETLKSKHHALVIKGVRGKFCLYLNETEVGESEAGEDSYFDLSGRLAHGDNLVELRFIGEKEALLSSGILGKIEYVRFDSAIIKSVTVNRRIEGGIVGLELNVSMLGEPEHVRAVATLVSSSGQIYYGGLTRGRGNIVIKDPLYWWPKGLGVQNLYKLTVNLYGENEIEDTKEMRLGIRKISTPVNPNSSSLEANGTPFLPMGAVLEGIGEIDPLLFDKKLESLVTAAASSNFNTLVLREKTRMPSGFYDLCDTYGILVIRELSGREKSDFEELVALSAHPSLGFVDFVGAGDDIAFIAEKLHNLRPDLEFSSHDKAPVYNSEISLPSEKTYSEIIPAGERNLFSATLLSLMADVPLKLLSGISENYLCPSSLSDTAYLSGLVASSKIESSIRKARLEGGSGRAIFASLNQQDAPVSASSVDFKMRRKALHYKAAKFFSPLAVFAEREGLSVCFSVSNERRIAFVGQLELKIVDNENRVIYKEIADCQTAKNSSKKLFTRDFSEYVLGHENEFYLEYYIREGLSVASRGTLLFTEPKSFCFVDPKIDAKIVGRDGRYSITLTPTAYAKDVEIDFTDADAVFYENYIDLTQNSPYKISFVLKEGEDSADALSKSLRIRSLYDAAKNR